ncbi:c-type cytochrome [Spirulina sp. 06S082]|uniref:c-type cytochrome n=1 Tax=Spirulina sp. 06S082 TaxID=3110248 RepID=UPI002B21214C|nr:di-heme oxidoredictase family protein [Spirulina sp. 06S082]MEA5470611.1 di-heme oxidoredictase family protein [Spirulina sp. 06S082]
MTKLKRMLLALSSTLLLVGSIFTFNASALAQTNAITPEVNIDQQTLLNGDYTLRKVLESGEQFFSVPFTPYDGKTGDGMGEARIPSGPKSAQREAFYPHADINFLKLNGLGAQSCFECHNTIGTYHAPGTESQAMVRKPGGTGGTAGFASNAFINGDFPNPLTEIIRNSPHAFGSGYVQELANQITHELQSIKSLTHNLAQRSPGKNVSQSLDFSRAVSSDNYNTYNVGYGLFSSTYNPNTGQFTDDTSQVRGVATDLVVRPFQWKGIASSLRHFVRDALNFHFSMQASEKFGHFDCDRDGKIDEMTVGNVTALTSFVAMIRPPTQVIPSGKEDVVARGQQLFGQTCASCHIPKLRIQSPLTTLIANPNQNPDQILNCPGGGGGNSSIIIPEPSTESLAVIRQFKASGIEGRLEEAVRISNLNENSSPEAVQNLLEESFRSVAPTAFDSSALGYTLHLTPTAADNLPNYVYPRLPETQLLFADNVINVPLYSDLRLHDMGEGLSDTVEQQTDVQGIKIPARQFLTRPLWGVADSGPWLHDGRARDLKEAILMHESEGSEANPAIEAFKNLGSDGQEAIIAFLETLQLPPLPNNALPLPK